MRVGRARTQDANFNVLAAHSLCDAAQVGQRGYDLQPGGRRSGEQGAGQQYGQCSAQHGLACFHDVSLLVEMSRVGADGEVPLQRETQILVAAVRVFKMGNFGP